MNLASAAALKAGAGHLGYGACGIAVGHLDDSTSTPEVVVTTLNGELLVFKVTGSGSTLALSLIYDTIVEGSLGVYNSILIANLWTGNGSKNEVYVAGYMGLRRFHVP